MVVAARAAKRARCGGRGGGTPGGPATNKNRGGRRPYSPSLSTRDQPVTAIDTRPSCQLVLTFAAARTRLH